MKMFFLLLFSISNCNCNTYEHQGTKCDEKLTNSTSKELNSHRCLAYSKCCVFCNDDFNQRYISTDYNIIFRKRCNSVLNASGTISFSKNITFTQDKLVVSAPNVILEGQCPLFIFEDISELTLHDIEINCTSGVNVASAILVRNVESVQLHIRNITVYLNAKSAVTVLGGQFGRTVPVTSSNIVGSTFEDVQLVQSTYRFNVDLVLALYYGNILLSGVPRLLVQPSIDPALNYPTPLDMSIENRRKLRIFNFSEWTKIIGRDYEIILNDPHGTLGYATVEYEDEQLQLFKIALAVFIGAVILIFIRFLGPVSYLYKLAKTP